MQRGEPDVAGRPPIDDEDELLSQPVFICLGLYAEPGCGKQLTDEERHDNDHYCYGCARVWDERLDKWRSGGEDEELDALFGAPCEGSA